MRGELEAEQNCNILTPTIMAITAFLSRPPGLLNRGPGGPASLGYVPHSSIFSPTNLNFNCSIGGPEGYLSWVLVFSTASYLQLIELQLLNRGSWGLPQLGAGFLYRIFSPTDWTSCAPSYIIVWRPLFLLQVSQFRSQFNPSTVKVISWYSSTGCTCYLHRCIFYFDSLTGGQYVIYLLFWLPHINPLSDFVTIMTSLLYFHLYT